MFLELLPWALFLGFVGAMLALDLGVFHRSAHEVHRKEALAWSVVWIGLAILFNVGVYVFQGSDRGLEWTTGYLIEKSLSVDNVFVWSMLFSAMAIPVKYQHRVLFWGIFGALALRLVFILVGQALLQRFDFLLLVFGAFLLYTGVKVLRHRDDEDENVKTSGVSILRRFIPVTDKYDGHKFFTTEPDPNSTTHKLRRVATPLFAAVVVVELTDLVFALDSVPAVLAVAKEPFIVFASNAFAILGLRAMYFLLADAKQRFHYLSHALGLILMFVGVKMSISRWYHINTYLSLGIILAFLVAAIVFSERRHRQLDSAGDGHQHGPKDPEAAALS